MALSARTMLALFVLLGLHSATAKQYTVGGSGGWTYQTNSNTFYSDQFKSDTLLVGDTLLFPFTFGAHNVYEIPPADLPACNFANPIQIYTASNSIVTLSSPGVHAFGCEIPTHCSQSGMQLSVTVSAGAPAAAPTTPPVAPPTPPPASPPTPPPASPPTPAPVTPPTTSPAPTTKAPAPSKTPSKAPAKAPTKAPTPTPIPGSPTIPVEVPAPTPAGPGSNNAVTITSGCAMVLAIVIAGFAFLLF